MEEGGRTMTAPAMILFAEGSEDPKVASVFHTLRREMQSAHPHLEIQLAFLGGNHPTAQQVVSTLAHRGAQEVVLAPMDVARVCEASEAMQATYQQLCTLYPKLRFAMARPIGPVSELLNVVDARLRSALNSIRATELDALVLCAPSAGDTRGNALIARRARQWSSHHKLPTLVAHADGRGADVAAAIASLRSTGRRSIAVGSLHIAADQSYRAQAEIALASGAIAVSAPLGADVRIAELAMARYAFASMDMVADLIGEDLDTAEVI